MMINCNSMRATVIFSGSLLLAGLALGVLAMSTPLVAPISYASLILVLAASVVLGGLFLVALLPGVAQRLEECQH
jgi:hypothetical protein